MGIRSSTIVLAFSVLFFATGCACETTRSPLCDEDEDCGVVDAPSDVQVETIIIPGAVLDRIELSPPSVELASTNGSQPTAQFAVTFFFTDGTSRAGSALFTLASRALGEVDGNGLFTANGEVGGTVVLTATASVNSVTRSATATVRVSLDRTNLGTSVPTDIEAQFTAATEVTTGPNLPGVVYPLTGAVMPQNVYPADIQWTRSTAGDVFRITLQKPSARIVTYQVHDPSNHFLPDTNLWRAMAQTEVDQPMQIVVERLRAGQRLVDPAVTVTFARAAISGSVYYWDIDRGRIVRIDDGTAQAIDFMPSPPDDGNGDRCVGCHSVSPSGRYMGGRLGGNWNNRLAFFDLTTDLTADPAPTTNVPTARGSFSTWNPDETRIAMPTAGPGGNEQRLGFFEALTGIEIAMTGTGPGPVTMPEWSPDGTRIAYVTNTSGDGANTRSGDIGIITVNGNTLGTPTLIHTASTLSSSHPTDTYPTWTPDSAMLAFSHGNGSRSDTYQGALYMMNPDGSNVVRLSTACGGPATTNNYQPNFSPFRQGGYYWMSFLSRRQYGNDQRGTGTTTRQQIWVAAIREGAAPGEDPSQVPYWLPGQRTTSLNISAYWAPRPCRPTGDACTTDAECCTGECGTDPGTGARVCSPPPPEACRMQGNTCSEDTDCCAGEGLTCISNVCDRIIG